MTAEAFDTLLAHQTAADETACVILEPIQGEGGVHQVPKEFLQHVRKRCDETGMLLIFDEVQCGVGRCSNGETFWAHQLVGVEPDLLAFAKAIASGMPLGGICGPRKFFEPLSKNALGSTYGGNAVCLAAASATLDVIQNENLLTNAHEMGKKIAASLSGMPYLEGIRQHGAFVAADVTTEENGGFAVGTVIKNAVSDHNLVLHSCGSNALRIIPAYNIKENEVEIFADKLYATLKELPLKGNSGGAQTM
jgi:4-aminobutyrate aminotransferase-like enzyme